MTVTVLRNDAGKVLRAIEQLTNQQVLVGIPGTADPRKWTGTQINNAYLGYIQEYGTMDGRIPARPWLRPGVAAAIPNISRALVAGARAALSIPPAAGAAVATFTRVGLIAQREVRARMGSNIPPPLAAATLERRRNRKVAPRQGTVALIDTGQLRNSVSFVIRPVA